MIVHKMTCNWGSGSQSPLSWASKILDNLSGYRLALIIESVDLVPKVGIEPTLPKEHDFESCASACSATSAGAQSIG
jgi:hypothetical protein